MGLANKGATRAQAPRLAPEPYGGDGVGIATWASLVRLLRCSGRPGGSDRCRHPRCKPHGVMMPWACWCLKGAQFTMGIRGLKQEGAGKAKLSWAAEREHSVAPEQKMGGGCRRFLHHPPTLPGSHMGLRSTPLQGMGAQTRFPGSSATLNRMALVMAMHNRISWCCIVQKIHFEHKSFYRSCVLVPYPPTSYVFCTSVTSAK